MKAAEHQEDRITFFARCIIRAFQFVCAFAFASGLAIFAYNYFSASPSVSDPMAALSAANARGSVLFFIGAFTIGSAFSFATLQLMIVFLDLAKNQSEMNASFRRLTTYLVDGITSDGKS